MATWPNLPFNPAEWVHHRDRETGDETWENTTTGQVIGTPPPADILHASDAFLLAVYGDMSAADSNGQGELLHNIGLDLNLFNGLVTFSTGVSSQYRREDELLHNEDAGTYGVMLRNGTVRRATAADLDLPTLSFSIARGNSGSESRIDRIMEGVTIAALVFGGSEALGSLGAGASSGGDAVVQVAGPGAEAGVTGGTVTGEVGAGVTAGDAATAAAAADVGNSVAMSNNTAQSTTNATGSAATSGIGALANSAGETVGDTTGDIISGIKGFIDDAKSTISDIVTPITDTFHEITGLVNQVNNDLIQPIVQPIKSIIANYDALTTEIHRDLGDGLKGILRLPTDITNALTSVDATMQRSIATLSQANAEALTRVLGPVLNSPSGAPFGQIVDTWARALAPATGKFSPPPPLSLGDTPNVEFFKQWVDEQQKLLEEDNSLPAQFFHMLFVAAGVIEGLTAQREPYVDVWTESIRKSTPVKRLDIGTVMELQNRGELTREQVQEELSGQGLSEARIDALISSHRNLHALSSVQNWYARGWVDNNVATSMLKALGWDADAIQLILDSAYNELGAGDLIDMLRRGIITSDELQAALERGGLREEDAHRLLLASIKLLGLNDMAGALDRATLVSMPGSYSDLGDAPPEAFVALCARQGIEAGDAAVLWAGHFTLLPPSVAVSAYFRNIIDRNKLGALLLASGIPASAHQDYIDSQRPQITVRQLPAMIKAGIMTQGEAEDYMRTFGYSDVDALRIIKLALPTTTEASAEAADTLHGLTNSTVTQLYSSGSLSREQAKSLLGSLGLGSDAAELTLSLLDIKEQAAERQAQADTIVTQAQAGQYDFDSAQRALLALGLTTQEVAKSTAALEKALTSKSKLPSEAKMLDMYRLGILDRASTAQALGLLGYSEGWAELIIQLKEGNPDGSAEPQ